MDETPPLTKMLMETKMLLAARIDDLIIEKGWSKSDFAAKVGKKSSEISKWLSGTHNFAMETLCQIAIVMEIKFRELFTEPKTKEVVFRVTALMQSLASLSPYPNSIIKDNSVLAEPSSSYSLTSQQLLLLP